MAKSVQQYFAEALASGVIQKFNIESRGDGAPLKNYGDTGHELEAEKIDAIKQKNSKGFTVYDIDPNNLDRENYQCSYNGDTLGRVLGYGYDSIFTPGSTLDSVTGIAGPVPINAPVPYWRTVQIDRPGTWIKVEILDARFNETTYEVLYAQPENRPNSTPQNTNQNTGGNYDGSVVSSAARRHILLDFESVSPAPHIVKSGDVFKTYFTSVFLTFKQMNCRIRVTIGYNSEVVETPSSFQSLPFGTGEGFEKEINYLTPFCITQRDISPPTFGLQIFATGSKYWCLIQNPLTYDPPTFQSYSTNKGVSVFWLTDFKTILSSGTTYEGDIELCIGQYDPASLTFQPTTILKRLASTFLKENSPMQSCIKEPVRVTLRAGQCLYLRTITAAFSGTVLLKFALDGYGPTFRYKDNNPTGNYCFVPNTFYSEVPFIGDIASIGMPRR